MSSGRTVTLNTGAKIPQIGYGTWQAAPGEVGAGVYEALKIGYRHLDLAKVYGNQKEVGEGIKKALAEVPGLKREDIFITSKLWNNAHNPEDVAPALDDTLAELGLEYLDLYLIHWPVAFEPADGDVYSDDKLMPSNPSNKDFAHLDSKTTLAQTWQAMVDLKKAGKVKSVGVSNFTPAHIEGIIKATGFTPAVNQIEAHPLLPQEGLAQYSLAKGIHLTAYSPLGNSANYLAKKSGEDARKFDILQAEEVQQVAKKLNVEPGQVLIAWGAQRPGFSIIPKSVTPERIEKNFQQVQLSPEDFDKVSSRINVVGGKRMNIPWDYTPKWDINVFEDPVELQHSRNHPKVV